MSARLDFASWLAFMFAADPPWEYDPRGGYSRRYEVNGVAIEDRWDGETNQIARSAVMPGYADSITVNLALAGKG